MEQKRASYHPGIQTKQPVPNLAWMARTGLFVPDAGISSVGRVTGAITALELADAPPGLVSK
jgi:hypothetical protein